MAKAYPQHIDHNGNHQGRVNESPRFLLFFPKYVNPLLFIKSMIVAFYKRIFLPYQAILFFIMIVHIFVADIHLRPDSKEQAEMFIAWLHRAAQEADQVYILGDLFDYWYTGVEASFQNVLAALQSPKISLLWGNRDFLLGNTRLEGINIIHEEETVITIGATKVLIAHGHTLIHADVGFKLIYRFGWPILMHLDRLLPLPVKERIARRLVRSSNVVRHLTASISERIATEKGVDMVICGHLHQYITRPGLIVLPAFHDSRAWLTWDAAGPRLCTE